MTAGSERVEGQTLATVILAALDRATLGGEKPDWSAFIATYEVEMSVVATSLQRRYRGLHGLEPEEVVRAFLVAKVFPPEKARVLLQVVARGEQPLKPRLLASLGLYCVDLHRSGVRQPVSGNALPDILSVPTVRPTPEEVEQLLSRQLRAIRAAFEQTSTRAPYRGALLLHHRVEWAWVLSGVTLSGVAGHGEVTCDVEHVVALTHWTADESEQVLGDDGIVMTLGLAWDRLRVFVREPGPVVTGDRIAEELGIPRERWDGWISRGRHRLKIHLGGREAFSTLFPTWASDRA